MVAPTEEVSVLSYSYVQKETLYITKAKSKPATIVRRVANPISQRIHEMVDKKTHEVSKDKLGEKFDVLLFSKQNYKVHADIGCTDNLMWRCTMVFDTGAEPKCIARKAPPPRTEDLIKSSLSIRVVGAGGKSLEIAGSIILNVRFGPYTVNTAFLVCESLQVDFILVPILRTIAKKLADHRGRNPIEEEESKKKPASNKIRVSKKAIVQPGTRQWVTVTTQRSGNIITSPHKTLGSANIVSTSNGLACVKHNRPFQILAANFAETPIRL
eukprot:IDg8503t1